MLVLWKISLFFSIRVILVPSVLCLLEKHALQPYFKLQKGFFFFIYLDYWDDCILIFASKLSHNQYRLISIQAPLLSGCDVNITSSFVGFLFQSRPYNNFFSQFFYQMRLMITPNDFFSFWESIWLKLTWKYIEILCSQWSSVAKQHPN